MSDDYKYNRVLRQEISFGNLDEATLSKFSFTISDWEARVGPQFCFERHKITGETRPIHADLPLFGIKKGDYFGY